MPDPFPKDVTVGRLRELVALSVAAAGDTPDLDALILLETATGRARADLLAELRTPVAALLSDSALSTLHSFVEARRRGVSIAYITGVKEFYGYEFAVGPGVLVPRPETEHLVDEGLRLLQPHHHAFIHDSFTGSGCVGISLALERSTQGYSTDLLLSDQEPTALRWAQRNAETLLSGHDEIRYTVERRDILTPRSQRPRPEQMLWHERHGGDNRRSCDLITANPPYLTAAEMDELQTSGNGEPTGALDGGPDGLNPYRKLAPQAFAQLRPERYVLVEHGWMQGVAVRTLFTEAGFEHADTVVDLAGRDRVLRARRPADNS